MIIDWAIIQDICIGTYQPNYQAQCDMFLRKHITLCDVYRGNKPKYLSIELS